MCGGLIHGLASTGACQPNQSDFRLAVIERLLPSRLAFFDFQSAVRSSINETMLPARQYSTLQTCESKAAGKKRHQQNCELQLPAAATLRWASLTVPRVTARPRLQLHGALPLLLFRQIQAATKSADVTSRRAGQRKQFREQACARREAAEKYPCVLKRKVPVYPKVSRHILLQGHSI